MSELVERVARAISDAEGIPYTGKWADYLPAARAAIEAMRAATADPDGASASSTPA